MAVTYQDFVDAIAAYWGAKRLQFASSAIAEALGAGTAGSVRGGKHFAGIPSGAAERMGDMVVPRPSQPRESPSGLDGEPFAGGGDRVQPGGNA